MWYKLEIKNEVMFVSGKVQKDASPAQNPLDYNRYLKGTLAHQEIQVQQECEYWEGLNRSRWIVNYQERCTSVMWFCYQYFHYLLKNERERERERERANV